MYTLQYILDSAVRVILLRSKLDHIIPLLRILTCPPISQSVTARFFTVTHRPYIFWFHLLFFSHSSQSLHFSLANLLAIPQIIQVHSCLSAFATAVLYAQTALIPDNRDHLRLLMKCNSAAFPKRPYLNFQLLCYFLSPFSDFSLQHLPVSNILFILLIYHVLLYPK